MIQVVQLDSSVTDDDLYNYFKEAGEVVWWEVCKEGMTCESLGYGYVSFAGPEFATRAVKMFDCSLFKGSSIFVGLSEFSFNKLIVQVDFDPDENGDEIPLVQENLRIPFENYGTITQTHLYEKAPGEHFFYVTYDHHLGAARAATALKLREIPYMFLAFKQLVDPHVPHLETLLKSDALVALKVAPEEENVSKRSGSQVPVVEHPEHSHTDKKQNVGQV